MSANKYQEALDYVLVIVKSFISHRNTTGSKLVKHSLTLQELVDRETPMKPIKLNDEYYCARCNTMVKELFKPYRYERCHDRDCGQVVDWSDGDE